MMKKTGMLIITNPNKFVRYVPRLQKEVQKTLYIQILPHNPKNQIEKSPSPRVNGGPCFSSSVKTLYRNSISAKSLDIRVLLSSLKTPNFEKIVTKKPVEIVYFDQQLNNDEMYGFLVTWIQNRTRDCSVVSLEESEDSNFDDFDKDNLDTYNEVVLGGTFDRLHCGHKALLSEAILRCKRKLTVGVTNLDMLKSKKLWELIEPCEKRMDLVRQFVDDIEPSLEYNIMPIGDVYGPTKDDPSFEALVVSSETLKGSVMVNEERAKKGLHPLKVYSLGLLPDTKLDDIEEDKVSSSNDRLRLLGTRLKMPEENHNIPKWPYVIGLTGGICSGKTAIANDLASMGAALINCDILGHQVYRKGKKVYDSIINEFGPDILSSNGEIDRNKLGSIVFSNKEKLKKLNEMVWPAILEQVNSLVSDHSAEGKKIVVLEAAVLIEAGWQKYCHELWTSIIPPDEAMRRMKERSLTESEAAMRLASQPANIEYVKLAHVVFCSLWQREYTQKQVRRAWECLGAFLESR